MRGDGLKAGRAGKLPNPAGAPGHGVSVVDEVVNCGDNQGNEALS